MLLVRFVVAPFLVLWGLAVALVLVLGAVLAFVGSGEGMTVRVTFPRMK